MTTRTAKSIPEWWATDPEHAPTLMALERLDALSFIVDDEGSAQIDFEGLWEHGPCSSGERIIIGLAWCLYNSGWALDYELALRSKEPDAIGPVSKSHPANALGTLGDSWWALYQRMIETRRAL